MKEIEGKITFGIDAILHKVCFYKKLQAGSKIF